MMDNDTLRLECLTLARETATERGNSTWVIETARVYVDFVRDKDAGKCAEAADEIERLRALNERVTAFLVREADSLTNYPSELHENAQRFRLMAAELTEPFMVPKA